ncbi:hypothetical protein GGX14DRAFT_568237 [Mycena pura]|uniref:Uncharacterized protein n=1 Tax=Mycena pura TaxID=153505 RepID=A0AAD6V908_9AGAR|nr:hypothetical protein GGX14DRAFT_568237 [Mycena pura]
MRAYLTADKGNGRACLAVAKGNADMPSRCQRRLTRKARQCLTFDKGDARACLASDKGDARACLAGAKHDMRGLEYQPWSARQVLFVGTSALFATAAIFDLSPRRFQFLRLQFEPGFRDREQMQCLAISIVAGVRIQFFFG